MKTKRSLLSTSVYLCLGLVAVGISACAKNQPVDKPEPLAAGAELAVDSNIKIGQLDNGLTYYILKHKKPENRALLWVGVNAGSTQEDDSQQGLAHFVEHMAFNGTKDFAKQEIVNYVESIGMRFGAHLNAYTGFDETVYMLQVPTEKPDVISKGMHILEQWAHQIAFEDIEIEKERGVVLEEWRRRRGANQRVIDKALPVIFKGSAYASRLPIGKPEILKNAPPSELKRYYKDWYRPDLMAVVAVGDFDPAFIEDEIKKYFSPIPAADKPRPRNANTVPTHDDTRIVVTTDPELTQASMQVAYRVPARPKRTDLDYRRMLTERIFHAMLNTRFSEQASNPEAPFTQARSGDGSWARVVDSFWQRASPKQGKVVETLSVLLTEVERVNQHGFTTTELARQKAAVLRNYRRMAAERDKRSARGLAAEILRHYFKGELMPGIEAELALAERLLPQITLEDVNGVAKKWAGQSPVVSISGPVAETYPDKPAILAMLDAAKTQKLAAYVDKTTDKALFARTVTPGSVTSRSMIDALGVHDWKLSNGVRVLIKPTDFRNDQILLAATSPGGYSLVDDSTLSAVHYAPSLIAAGGLAGYSKPVLRKYLADKLANASVSIGLFEENVRGSAAPADLESMLQQVHLRFVAPRADNNAFTAWRNRRIEWIRNDDASPRTRFRKKWNDYITQGDARRRIADTDAINAIDFDQAMKFYRERFADADDFTFVIVGNIDLKVLEPMLNKYIATLPALASKDTWKPVGTSYPSKPGSIEVKAGTEPQSSVTMQFYKDAPWSREAAADVEILSMALRYRLRELLREDMGGVYSVGAYGTVQWRPSQRFVFDVTFGCAPENVDKLQQAVKNVITEVQAKGIGKDYLAKIFEQQRRSFQTARKTNRFWIRGLIKQLRHNRDISEFVDIEFLLKRVSSQRIATTAKTYLDTKRVHVGVRNPESS